MKKRKKWDYEERKNSKGICGRSNAVIMSERNNKSNKTGVL